MPDRLRERLILTSPLDAVGSDRACRFVNTSWIEISRGFFGTFIPPGAVKVFTGRLISNELTDFFGRVVKSRLPPS
jgi:hypothetical protein